MDINQATAENFIQRVGFTPNLANRIVEERVQNGQFNRWQQVQNIRYVSLQKMIYIKQRFKLR